MATDRTVRLDIQVPQSLSEAVERAARIENRTPDAFIQEAIERHLLLKRHRALQEYGKSKAREYGLTEHDLPSLIAESREESAKRGR